MSTTQPIAIERNSPVVGGRGLRQDRYLPIISYVRFAAGITGLYAIAVPRAMEAFWLCVLLALALSTWRQWIRRGTSRAAVATTRQHVTLAAAKVLTLAGYAVAVTLAHSQVMAAFEPTAGRAPSVAYFCLVATAGVAAAAVIDGCRSIYHWGRISLGDDRRPKPWRHTASAAIALVITILMLVAIRPTPAYGNAILTTTVLFAAIAVVWLPLAANLAARRNL